MRNAPTIAGLLPALLFATIPLFLPWISAPVLAASGDVAPQNRERFLRYDGDPSTATDEQVIEALSGVRVSSIRFNFNVVRAVQSRLTELGYDPKGIDGFWGQNTLNALNAYREAARIPQRNFLDWGTLAHLFGVDYVRWKLGNAR